MKAQKKHIGLRLNCGKKPMTHVIIEVRRIRVKKRFLILFVLLLALLMVVSCKKKEDSSNNGPVVTVAQDKSDYQTREPKTFDKEIPTLTVREDVEAKNDNSIPDVTEESSEVNKERKLSFVYRGGNVLLRSSFSLSQGEIKTNISEEDSRYFVSRLIEEKPEYLDKFTVSFASDTVTLTYSSDLSDEELYSFWDDVKDLMDRINEEKVENKTLSAQIGDNEISAVISEEKAEIILPDGIEKKDVDSFMVFLSENNPTLASKAMYEVENGVLSLYYTQELVEGEEENLWKEMVKEAESFFTKKVEEVEDIEVVVDEKEEPVIISEAKKETESLPSLSPLTNAGRLIDRFSISLSLSAKVNDGFDSDIKAAFDVAVTPSFRVGASLGYEVKGYIPLSLRVRYGISLFKGLYGYVDGGWRFGLFGNKGNIILSLGLGYEFEVFDNFLIFGELDGQIAFADSVRFLPSIAIGGRYRF